MFSSRRSLAILFTFLGMALSFAARAQTLIATIPAGISPGTVAMNQATNKIYFADGAGVGHTVAVIDGATNAVTSVPVGRQPIALAVNPVTNKIYVANYLDATLTVVDGYTNTTNTVSVGIAPLSVAVNSKTNKIFVGSGDTTVTVIDGATLSTQIVPVGHYPNAIVVNPVTNRIYVVNSCGDDVKCLSTGTVTVINGDTLTTAKVSIGLHAAFAAVNTITNKVFVSNGGESSVTVIDGTNLGASTVTVGLSPGTIAADETTNRVYVVNRGETTISVIDGTTLIPHKVNLVLNGPRSLALNALTNKIYVTVGNQLIMVDGIAETTNGLQVGNVPFYLAVNTSTDRIYVGNQQDNSVSVVAGGVTTYNLTVAKGGSGSGTVTSGDGYISCGSSCSHIYNRDSQVVLTPTPAAGSTFNGWTGCDSVQGTKCTAVMINDRNPTAAFDVAQVTLISLAFNPASVRGGGTSIATLTLSAPAPEGGVGIAISSDNPSVVQAPSLVVIPGGKTSISFATRTTPVRTNVVATVTAKANSSHSSGTLTVTTQLSQ